MHTMEKALILGHLYFTAWKANLRRFISEEKSQHDLLA